MSTILARSYGDLDKDGYHDLEDKFPTDPIYWQDDDDDGLPDSWERSIAGNLTTLDGTGDQDSDTITDAEEFTLGTSPTEKSIRLKVGSARVAVFSDEGTVKSRITWVPVQVTGMTYRVYRLSLGSLQLIGTNISEYAFVDEHRGDPADVYFVVAVSDAGEEGPRVQTLRYEISASGFTPEKLVQVNTPSPGGNTLLYGVIEHPLTGCLVEQGELIIYGTTGTYYATIVQGRVRLKVTAPATDTGDSPWTVVLQTDGGTYQLDPLSLDVAEGYTVTNLKTSSAAGSATVTFTRASGYGYTKVEVSEVGGSTQVLYEGVGSTCQATEFEQGALLTFKLTPYRLITNQEGDQVPEYGAPLLIRERVGWGGQLLRDTVISWNNDAEDQKYPHFVFSTITVPVGLSLTIEPETWLQFRSNSVNLIVYGSLIADGGDATHRIFMSSTSSKKSPNNWGYVQFLDGSTGVLNHVYLGYGDSDAQVLVDGGDVTLSNCQLNTVSTVGIQIQNSPTCTVINCTIENMSRWGIKNLSTAGVISLLANTVSNCTSGGIYAGNATFDGNTLNGNGTHDSIYVNGTINGNVVWSQNIKFNQVTIPAGSKLSIVPGVQCFGYNSVSYIQVYGQLTAEGTSAQPIVFTSAQETKAAGQWRGILINDGSVVTLRHAVIEYAGGNYGAHNAALEIKGGTVVIDQVKVHDIENTSSYGASGILITNSPVITVTGSTFKDIENWGIVDSATSEASFTGNSITDCITGAISNTNPATIISGNTLSSNGNSNAVYFTGTVSGDVTWSQNTRFYMVTIATGAKLTILPGVQCFGRDSSSFISVAGELLAEGTSSQPIVFTSAQETKAAGQWRGIFTNDGSVVTLRHAVIEYAGGNYGAHHAALEIKGGTVVIDQVKVHDIENTSSYGASGILITNSPVITVTGSTFKDIENWGIVDSATSEASFTGNSITDCITGAISTTNPATIISGNTLSSNGNSNAVYFTGTVSGDVTWSQNTRFYMVTIATGAKLTILPGVQCFGRDSSSFISVAGELLAEGTSSQPIVFTSAQETKAAGQWRGILINDGSVVTLRHAVIEYAGGNYGAHHAALEIKGGTVVIDQVKVHDIENTSSYGASGILITNSPVITVTGSTFKDIENWGIVDSATSEASFTGNSITDCITGAISTTNPATIISGNTLTNNGNSNAVYFTGTVSGDVTWSQNVRFNLVTVEANATLTILPGVTCYGHNAASYIYVNGQLTADGTTIQPIQFTSAQATKAAGQWRGIISNAAGSDVILRHVSIEYAGGNASGNTAALEVRGGTILVDQVSIDRITNVNTSYGADGIWIKDGAMAEIIQSRIENVENWAIRNNATGLLTLNLAYSVIRNNGYGIYSNGQDIDARLVNWGYITGPYHGSLNTGGEGNEVRGNVLFTPWLLLNGTYYDFETGGWGKDAWATSGDGAWTVSSDTPLRGGYSAKAPLLSDDQSAALNVIANCGEGYVSFTYGVDSALGDNLEFYIDGTLVNAYSGTVNSAMTPVNSGFLVSAGSHTFTWVWRKDGEGASGDDTAWIDDVILPLAEGHVEGKIVTDATDASTPLVNATVTLSDGTHEYTVTTDEQGEYTVYNILYGTYTLEVEKDGYQVSTQSVTVDSMGIRVVADTNISLVDTSTLYTQEEVDQQLADERAKWDANGDGKMSLEDAIHALQVLSGE